MKPPFFARYGLPILMLVVFLSPFMLMGTRRSLLSNKNDIKSWLPPAYEETHEYEWYCQRFQTDLFVLASWEGCTLDSTKLELLARKLVPAEDEPPSETEFQFFRSAVTGSRLIRELMDREGLSREEAIKRLTGFLIGKDGVTTCLVLTVRPEAEAEWETWPAKYKPADSKFTHALVERVYSVAENECAIPREELHLGGPPVDAASIDIEGERTLMRLLWVCAAVGVFMSWWCLRSWPLAAMVFATALASAGSSLFLTWATGTDMNAILLTMPMLVFVAATSGAIHLANYYRDTVRQNAAAGMPDPTYGAADRAIKNAWLPSSLATGTTAIGLGSLAIS